MTGEKIILAVETAFAGGSLSLFVNDYEIDCWTGAKEISKAEDILLGIDELLKKNNFERININTIIVAREIGGLTGLRIGQALGRGLSKSLNCEYREISVLESLLIKRNKDGIIITAVMINKIEVFYEVFRTENGVLSQSLNNAARCSLETLKKLLVQMYYNNFIFYDLQNEYASDNLSEIQLFSDKKNINLRESLSTYLGLYFIAPYIYENDI
jgi:tRNA A37 threonylcarbamoyladenosine modification protein TsaB